MVCTEHTVDKVHVSQGRTSHQNQNFIPVESKYWYENCTLFLQSSVAWMKKPPVLAHSLCTENSKSVANNKIDIFQVCFCWEGGNQIDCDLGSADSIFYRVIPVSGTVLWGVIYPEVLPSQRKWQNGVLNVTFCFSLLNIGLFEKYLWHFRVLSFFYPNNFHIKCTLHVFWEASCPCQPYKTVPRVWKSIMFLLPCMSSPCN